MFKQLCKHFPITLHIRQPIFTWKTYNHAVTYNHASADDIFYKITCLLRLWKKIQQQIYVSEVIPKMLKFYYFKNYAGSFRFST